MSAAVPESPVAAKVFPSPNHGERKDGRRPTMLVLHYTGMPDEGEALQWLCNPVSQVSAHYFVFEDGRVLQMVPGGAPRLACGRVLLGRGDRHQLLAPSASRSPIPAIRAACRPFPMRRSRASPRLPRTSSPAGESRQPGAGAFRRRSRPQGRSGRALSLAAAARGRRRPLGAPAADPRRALLLPAATRACPSRRCRRCWPCTATA